MKQVTSGKSEIFLIAFFNCILLSIFLHGQPSYSIPGRLYRSIEETSLNPDSVTRIRLKGKKLKRIPPEVYGFKNLRELDLRKNRITSLNDSLALIEKLEVLRLSRNQIHFLDNSINKLKNLKYLDLGMNPLKSMPNALINLHNLEFLEIWGTEITSFPNHAGEENMNLKWLDMRNILLTQSEKEEIKNLFPKAIIYFSEGCNCAK